MPILIGYTSPGMEKICREARKARKTLPEKVAVKLPQRLSELAAFASLAAIPAGRAFALSPVNGRLGRPLRYIHRRQAPHRLQASRDV